MKGKTAHEVRMIVARPYLRQSCNFASTSEGSPAREHKAIMRASYGCLAFSENQLSVRNFVCNLLHGLAPAVNSYSTAKGFKPVSHQS